MIGPFDWIGCPLRINSVPFHALLAHPCYAPGMGRLVAMAAELIRIQPRSALTSRRRLLVERSPDSVERVAVRVTELAPEGCLIAGPENLADVDGRLWLKLPGLEACQIVVVDETAGHMVCRFAQPLSSMVYDALTRPTVQQVRNRSYRARCSFLG